MPVGLFRPGPGPFPTKRFTSLRAGTWPVVLDLSEPVVTQAVAVANPNWPITAFEVDFTQGPPSTPGAARHSLDAPYRRLAVRQWDTDRGRQYELDQVQAGTLGIQVHDPLELLNPDNTASPYNLGDNIVTPYRDIWVWAMWPNQPGSGNIINQLANVSYDPSFEVNPFGLFGRWEIAGGTTTVGPSSALAFDGSKSLRVAQSAAGAGFGTYNVFRTAPTLTYTFSAYVLPLNGCAVTIQVEDADGAVWTSATATDTNGWTRLSVTWNCVDTLEAITIYGTGVATPVFHVDATQLEFGAIVSPFTTTGPRLYAIYTGYVERWPTQYDMAGMRSTRMLAGVDALAVLSRTTITQTYDRTIRAASPRIYLPMTNAKPATSGGALSTGSETAVVTASNINGNPFYKVPSTGAINWAGDQHPDGAPAVVLTQQNEHDPPQPGGSNQDTYMDVLNTSHSLNTVTGGTIEFWARVVAGQVSLGGMFVQIAGGTTNYPTFIPQLVMESLAGGGLGFIYSRDGATDYGFVVSVKGGSNPNVYPDNTWHYFAMTVVNGSWRTTFDDIQQSYSVAANGNIGFNVICHISANTGFGDPQSQVSFGRFAVYGSDIGQAARLAHYRRGVGFIDEKSGFRVARLLAEYWQGNTDVAGGFLAMSPDFGYDGRVMLEVLQEIQESERGLVFADVLGTVVFQDRTTRYENQTPLWVFGENPEAVSPVEYPYTNYVPEMDPTYVFSQANLSRPGNNEFPAIINVATQAKYGQRIVSQTMQCNTDFDLTQAGIFYTQRYSSAKTRVTELVLVPSANPALWPVVLSLEISQLVTVRRRNAGVTVSGDYYIEKVSHRVDAENGKWEVRIQLSPRFTTAWVLGDPTYGVLGSTSIPVY